MEALVRYELLTFDEAETTLRIAKGGQTFGHARSDGPGEGGAGPESIREGSPPGWARRRRMGEVGESRCRV